MAEEYLHILLYGRNTDYVDSYAVMEVEVAKGRPLWVLNFIDCSGTRKAFSHLVLLSQLLGGGKQPSEVFARLGQIAYQAPMRCLSQYYPSFHAGAIGAG